MHCSDVIVFMSFVSLGLRKVVQLVETLISRHPQDPKKAWVTEAVCFQECSHKEPLGG